MYYKELAYVIMEEEIPKFAGRKPVSKPHSPSPKTRDPGQPVAYVLVYKLASYRPQKSKYFTFSQKD